MLATFGFFWLQSRSISGDYLVDPPPSSLCGITLGTSDYLDAEKLFGRGAVHITGGHPHGNRSIRYKNSVDILYAGMTPSKKGATYIHYYYIDALELSNWVGNLPKSLLRSRGKYECLSLLRYGETFAETGALLKSNRLGIRPIWGKEANDNRKTKLTLDFAADKLIGIRYWR